jgi:deoxyribonuclease-4
MLVGAHVSPAGGLPNAIERGVERECEAIQIFHQSPRAWRPTNHTDEAIAEFKAAMADSPIDAVLIHAVYLINTATEDKEMRAKSLESLTHALRLGDAIGAVGVVLHAGSAKASAVDGAIKRAGKVIAAALQDSDRCPLHVENTAGAGGTLGRSFDELARIIDAAGGGKRLGVCLDSCHLYAAGYEVTTAETLNATIDEFDAVVGCDRLGSLHVNDSVCDLGSNRDRHAPLGAGKLGESGCAVFLSEPRFEGLPAVFEGPGVEGKAPALDDIREMAKLRKRGLAARKRKTSRGGKRASARAGKRA